MIALPGDANMARDVGDSDMQGLKYLGPSLKFETTGRKFEKSEGSR